MGLAPPARFTIGFNVKYKAKAAQTGRLFLLSP